VSQYGQPADLATYGMTTAALSAFTTAEKNAALIAASNYADGELARRYTLPLESYGTELTEAVCHIAVYKLLSKRGFDSPGEGSSFRRMYDDAIAWLKRVGSGTLDPPEIVDTTTDEEEGGAYVVTNARRRWLR
jgi:phage gp36-like protein